MFYQKLTKFNFQVLVTHNLIANGNLINNLLAIIIGLLSVFTRLPTIKQALHYVQGKQCSNFKPFEEIPSLFPTPTANTG